MSIQMSAYLKIVLRNLVFNKRKGKAGNRQKASPQCDTKTKETPSKEQRGEKGQG